MSNAMIVSDSNADVCSSDSLQDSVPVIFQPGSTNHLPSINGLISPLMLSPPASVAAAPPPFACALNALNAEASCCSSTSGMPDFEARLLAAATAEEEGEFHRTPLNGIFEFDWQVDVYQALGYLPD
jgi:hypothetical protein